MSDKAYIIIGSRGEYDSFYTWNVCVYLDEDLAKEHVKLAEEKVAELHQWRHPKGYRWSQCRKERPENPYDPELDVTDDVSYHYEELTIYV